MLTARPCLVRALLRHARRLHWAKALKKKCPKDHALQHFDDFYGEVYGATWPSIRIALLSPHKYVAVVNSLLVKSDETLGKLRQMGALNLGSLYERAQRAVYSAESEGTKLDMMKSDEVPEEETLDESTFDDVSRILHPNQVSSGQGGNPLLSFVPSTKMIYREEVINESDYYNFYKPKSEMVVPVKSWSGFKFPRHLKAVVFGRGDISVFPAPKKTTGGLYEYYLMDGASILPVLALDLQEGEHIGDFCAAPGGKFLTMLLTQLPGKAFGCDNSPSRLKRLKNVLSSYVPEENIASISVVQKDILSWDGGGMSFDKILLDVPCTNDRHSLVEDDNNYFHQKRLTERLALPQKQMNMLSFSLKCLVPGGSLVYSTCTLSPIQNDGVVHMALQHLWETTSMEFAVVDLSQAFTPLRGTFRLFPDTKYGQVVLPYLPSNYGPMYICKIERIR